MTANENNKTQEQGNRFDHMNQKPQHDRKAFAALGIFVCAAVLLVICLSVYGVSYAKEHADEIAQSRYGWIVAGLVPDLMEEDTEKVLAGTNTLDSDYISEVNRMLNVLTTSDYDTVEDESTSDESNDQNSIVEQEADETATDIAEEPEYATEAIEFTLYEIPGLDDNILLSPEPSGSYTLESGKVYVIRWDAASLYSSDEGVNAKITAGGDFLIQEGNNGVISVNICDYNQDVVYSGELDITSVDGNLGIEFCADKCRIRGYGSRPEIHHGNFYLCFYTSGKYVEREHNSISGADGMYDYSYGTTGYASQNCLVTRPKSPEPSKEPPCPAPRPVPDGTPKSPVEWDEELSEEDAKILRDAYYESLGREALATK